MASQRTRRGLGYGHEPPTAKTALPPVPRPEGKELSVGFFSQAKWRLFDWFVLFGIGGLILAIVVPNFIKARASNHSHRTCIPQLRMIQGGVHQWALENNKPLTDTYSLDDKAILAYLRGSVLPKCPQGGHYSPGTNLSDLPKCSIGGVGHTL